MCPDFVSIFGVSQPPNPRRPGPPHNPGVRDLVEGKRWWSSTPKTADAKQGFRGWHERGYLPHRDEPGLTQFVTFHLADGFPESLRLEWEHFARIEDNRERQNYSKLISTKGVASVICADLKSRNWLRIIFGNFPGSAAAHRAAIRNRRAAGRRPALQRATNCGRGL